MRELIRPALFIIARTGLFLAVLGWATVGRYPFRCISPVGSLGVCHVGWVVFLYHNRSPDWKLYSDDYTDERVARWFPGATVRDWQGPYDLSFRGICLVRPPAGIVFTLPHWLTLTFFTVLNICLHFLYRKHSEAEPCEN